MPKITINLEVDEFIKLSHVAQDSLRTPTEQVHYLLRSILFGDGVISAIDDLTKRIEALEEAQRLREGEL